MRTRCTSHNSSAPYLNEQRAVVGCESWDTVPYTRKAFYGPWRKQGFDSIVYCGTAPGVTNWHLVYLQTWQLR